MEMPTVVPYREPAPDRTPDATRPYAIRSTAEAR
jgi:hypothetical protein